MAMVSRTLAKNEARLGKEKAWEGMGKDVCVLLCVRMECSLTFFLLSGETAPSTAALNVYILKSFKEGWLAPS